MASGGDPLETGPAATRGSVIGSLDSRPDPKLELPPLRFEAIYGAFQQRAAERPHKTALVHRGAKWTYQELETLSSRLAALLVARAGVAPGDVVAIVTDRNPAIVCAMLAVLKAGAAFAMIDDAYPEARVRACLQVARPRHVLLLGAAHRLGTVLTDIPATILPMLAADLAALVGGQGEMPPHSARHDSIAYLSFTSGSTGTPKCVATGHAPLPHFVGWHREKFGLTEADRFSMLSGISHDPLLRDIFTPLSIGATLHVPDQALLTDPSALFQWVLDEGITVCHLTPGIGQVVQAGATGRSLPELRWLFWGGDVLKPNLVAEFLGTAAHAKHVNFYGTTETPQAVGFFCVDDPDRYRQGIPVGRGIANTQLLVLNEDNQLSEVGEVGELVVRSRYLSRGYWGDSSASEKKYITNPHTGDKADWMYRTGDRARFRADGSVEFRGRSDDQVKIRGYRVELGEVSAVLRRHVSVEDAVVLGRELPSGDAQIVAYVTAKAARSVTAAELGEHVKAELPRYMHPASYRILPQFPLLPNGKVDRRALLEMMTLSTPALDVLPAGSSQERELAVIWSEVLGVSGVGVDESFYDLGGDSLTAIRVIIRMQARGLNEAMCRQILQGRTIAEIVRASDATGSPSLAGSQSAPPDARARLLLNVVRGFMVTLVVASHWIDGVLRQAPKLLPVARALNPLLNWPTPGFAMAFGMTLGFVHYPIYKTNPSRAKSLLRRGVLVVGAGVALFALDCILWQTLKVYSWNPLDNVLCYYLLALLTAPLWMWAVSRTKYFAATAFCLAATFFVIHLMLRRLPISGDSWVYMGPVLGKYSYFNLSAGAIVGLVLGYELKVKKRVPASYLTMGAGLMALGLGLSFRGGHSDFFKTSNDVELWKWAFYGGLLVVTMTFLDRWLTRVLASESAVEVQARIVGVIGQLAFPLFILDFLARDFGRIYTVFNASGVMRFATSVALFIAVATYLARKTYRLYYGGAEVAPQGATKLVAGP